MTTGVAGGGGAGGRAQPASDSPVASAMKRRRRIDTPEGGLPSGEVPGRRRSGDQWSSDLTISSHIFLASPNSIMVLSRKNSSFSTPA